VTDDPKDLDALARRLDALESRLAEKDALLAEKDAEIAALSAAISAGAPDRPAPTEAAGASGPGPTRVLVVEDNEFSRDALVKRLKRRGYEVREALDGLKAIEEAERWLPDVVLMDLSMPRLDGWRAIERLRAHEDPRVSGAGIIAVTANVQSESRLRAFEAGCDDYVTKPYKMKDVLELIERVTSERAGRARA